MDLPRTVRIREVGPRDGFQNEPETIATPDKVRLIDALARTGLRRLELTSFVRPDVIPQLADAEEVLRAVDIPEGVSTSVLIPNERGLDRARWRCANGSTRSASSCSASESHNRANVNRSIAESLDGLDRVIGRSTEAGPAVEAVICDVVRLPVRGRRAGRTGARDRASADQRRSARDRLRRHDRNGQPGPGRASSLSAAREELGDGVELTAHFHNTRGQGLANALAALQAGCESFESSFGELGGCPVPAGATGNIATEDLVSMLQEMGIETGIDLAALLDAARDAASRPRPPARQPHAHRGPDRLASLDDL